MPDGRELMEQPTFADLVYDAKKRQTRREMQWPHPGKSWKSASVTASMEDIPFDLRALRIIEYDKNDPYWGSNLRDQIEAALRETLESPLSAVLPSFLSQPDREIAKDVPERDQEIISLRQDLDLLKRETRSSSSRLTSREREISQSDAGILVAQLVESGVDDEVITRTLESQGAPLSWIRMRTRRARRALSPQREDVTSPSGED